ncbi:MAG: hypothetical protein ACK4UJ_02060 [Leptonema sp. (in: bacteria)]
MQSYTENVIRKYSNSLESFLRLDEEILDLFLSSPIDSLEFLLNRDISIYLKPYSLLDLSNINEILKQSHFYFSIFYKHLEETKKNPKIYIPMLRYFIFLGNDGKVFTLFLEFHKEKKMFPLLLLSAYFTTFDSIQYKKYRDFIENQYSKILYELLHAEKVFYYSFKKNFDVIKKKFYSFNYLKNQFEKLILLKEDYRKLLILNWIFTNLLTIGNFYLAYQFYLWIKKKEDFPLHKELLSSWETKLSLIFIKKLKLNTLKYLKNQRFYFYNQDEFWNKYKRLFPQFIKLSKQKIFKMLFHLEMEYNFFTMYTILHYFFEDVLLVGLKLTKKPFGLDFGNLWDSIQIKDQNRDFRRLLFANYFKEKKFEFAPSYVLYLLYKYRRKIILYSRVDPFFGGIVGLFYENFKPEISLSLYQSFEHPLVILRMGILYRQINKSDINKVIRKKVEKLKKSYNLVSNNYGE